MSPQGIRLIGMREDNTRVSLGEAGNLDDARAEAAFYLEDPRDTVQAVYFWNLRDQQYQGWLNRTQPVYRALRRRLRTDTLV